MAKRKITVTVDEDLVDPARQLGDENLSGVVNDALGAHVDLLARLGALRTQLERWDAEGDPISAKAADEAASAFDELDGVSDKRWGVA